VAPRAAVANPSPPATAGVNQIAARELVAWLTVEKGLDGSAASAVSFGDGGVATLANDRQAGEPLLEIPQNLCVTSVDVADSPIVSGLAAGRGEVIGLALWQGRDGQFCSPRHRVPFNSRNKGSVRVHSLAGPIIWLCHERAKGELSDWAPYIATLPPAG
jgi:hypothetical protein